MEVGKKNKSSLLRTVSPLARLPCPCSSTLRVADTIFLSLPCSIILFSFLAVVNCLTVPPRSPSTNDTLITADALAAVPALVKRDDEWTMVLYNEHKKGSQCGGTSSAKSGDSDQCLDITSKKCVDLSVKRDLGIADCTFNFRLRGSTMDRR